MAAPTSSKVRERTRRARIWRLVLILGLIDFYLWYRYLTDNPSGCRPSDRRRSSSCHLLAVRRGRADDVDAAVQRGSPHQVVRPEEIEIGLDQVAGPRRPGGRGRPDPRRVPRLRDLPRSAGRQPAARILFEGPPGTGRRSSPRRWPSRPACVPLHRRAGVPVDVVRRDELEDPVVLPAPAQARRKEGARSGSSRRSTRSAANAAG